MDCPIKLIKKIKKSIAQNDSTDLKSIWYDVDFISKMKKKFINAAYYIFLVNNVYVKNPCLRGTMDIVLFAPLNRFRNGLHDAFIIIL